MIYRASQYDHSMSLLKELNWLWVPKRIEFKLYALVFELQWVGLPRWQSAASDWQWTRVTLTRSAVIFVVNTDHPSDTLCDTGWPTDHAFPVVKVWAWNALPDYVMLAPTFLSFEQCFSEDICFPTPSHTDDMHHTDFVMWSWNTVCLHHIDPVIWWWW